MFDFLSMLGTYQDRKVARFERDGLVVDTCSVTDSDQPFETAIGHPEYNKGKLVIVAMYENEADARAGHNVWVHTMTRDDLPEELIDVSTATCAKRSNAAGQNCVFPRTPVGLLE